MKRRLISVLAVMAVATVAVVAYQQSWKGIVVAEPGRKDLTLEQRLSGLAQFTECGLVVEGLSDALKDAINKDDIETWVRNRLVNTGLKVVTLGEQILKYGPEVNLSKTDEAALRTNDRFFSNIYVIVGGLKDSSGRLVYTIRIVAKRGVFIHPGYFGEAATWDTGAYGYAGSALEIKTVLREQVNKRMDKFEADWKKANR